MRDDPCAAAQLAGAFTDYRHNHVGETALHDADDNPAPVRTELEGAKLKDSLKSCRRIVADYRERLTSPSLMTQRPEDREEADLGAQAAESERGKEGGAPPPGPAKRTRP